MDGKKIRIKSLSRDWLRASGSDALRFLNGMLTCDLKRAWEAARASRQPTAGEGLLLNTKGRAIAPVIFMCDGTDHFLLSVPAGFGENARADLDHHLVADDVELSLETAARSMSRVLSLPDGGMDASSLRAVSPHVPDAKDKVFFSAKTPWGFRVPRRRLSGRHEEFWIMNAASFDAVTQEMDDGEFLKARIEAGVPEWGVDYSEADLVLEFPFADAISFHKGCYIGQEVVARATYRGKMNRGFARFNAQDALTPGFIYSEIEPERAVGKVTSASGPKGLGLVRFSAVESGGGESDAPLGRLFQKTDRGDVLINSVEILV